MQILAIDASTERCSVALGGADGFVERSEAVSQRHSERLLPMVRALLGETGVALSTLDGIAFGAGPGSFTGLRVACGVAQGLAFGLGLPLVGVPTLAAMAEAARVVARRPRVIAALDARMHEVYVAAYEFDAGAWRELIAPTVSRPEQAPVPPGPSWYGVGSGFAAYPMLRTRLVGALGATDAGLAPGARWIGALAVPRFAAGEGVAADAAAPLYVRHRVALTAAERAAGATL
jgi:tRNA threonylcarbamoyladenosine biosynthesis protein TsaB